MQIPIKPTESFQKKEEFTMPKVQKKTYSPQEWNEYYDSLEYLDDVDLFKKNLNSLIP